VEQKGIVQNCIGSPESMTENSRQTMRKDEKEDGMWAIKRPNLGCGSIFPSPSLFLGCHHHLAIKTVVFISGKLLSKSLHFLLFLPHEYDEITRQPKMHTMMLREGLKASKNYLITKQ
jgi:hypothetical protein